MTLRVLLSVGPLQATLSKFLTYCVLGQLSLPSPAGLSCNLLSATRDVCNAAMSVCCYGMCETVSQRREGSRFPYWAGVDPLMLYDTSGSVSGSCSQLPLAGL